MSGSKDSGVMNIKKKVAHLKQELDDSNDRAAAAEAALREKDVAVDKVSWAARHRRASVKLFDRFLLIQALFFSVYLRIFYGKFPR